MENARGLERYWEVGKGFEEEKAEDVTRQEKVGVELGRRCVQLFNSDVEDLREFGRILDD